MAPGARRESTDVPAGAHAGDDSSHESDDDVDDEISSIASSALAEMDYEQLQSLLAANEAKGRAAFEKRRSSRRSSSSREESGEEGAYRYDAIRSFASEARRH